MKALIQRVKKASVTIDGELYSEINAGLLVFLGVTKEDGKENSTKLAEKILKLRIFEDDNDKMNLSVEDIKEVEVKKDGSEYGMKGANGVIIIRIK